MLGSRTARLAQLLALTLALLVVLPGLALGDGIEADADALVAATPHANNMSATQEAGTTVDYHFSSQVKNTGNASNDVFPSGSSNTVTVSISRAGDWLATPSAGSPSSFVFSAYDSPQAGTIRIAVPSGTAGGTSKTMTVTLQASASNGKVMSPNSLTLSYTITASAPADTTPPETTIDSAPASSTASTSAAFTYISSESGSTFECKLDAGDYASCPAAGTSYSGLDDGSHTFQVRATDGAGNTDLSPDSHTWSIDSTAPQTTIDTAPSSPTASTSAAFTYTSSESGSTFACKLDAGDFASCPVGGTSYSGLGEGSHTFQVVATDGLGNADGSPASHTWVIDLTAPDTTIVNAPPSLTNSTDAAFTYTSTESGSTFACKLDAGDYVSCPAAGTSYSGLGEGSHTFSVKASDAVGNTDASAASYTWSIDVTPPAVSMPDLTDASDTGVSQIDNVTKDPTPSFTGTAEDGATVELLRDDVVVDSATATGGVWAFTSEALAEGTYSFTARATDAAGNDATSTLLSVVVDLTNPSIVEASRLPAGNGDGWNNSAVTVTWNCSDDLSGVVGTIDSETVSGEGAGQSASGSCSDIAGNSASASHDEINIDLTAPNASASATSNGSPYTAGTWTKYDVLVTYGCTDGLSGVGGIDGSETIGEGEDQSATGTCTDKAGNSDDVTFSNIDVDKTAPVIALASRLPAANTDGWNNSAVTVTWTCWDELSGATTTGDSETVSGEGAGQSATGSCADLAGNTASDTEEDINIDLTNPGIALASRLPAANTDGWNNSSVMVTWTCSDELSGPAASGDSETVSSEGAGQSATGDCADLAGNTASDTEENINIDLTDPGIVLASRLPAANANGWNNSAVTVTWTCSDDLSGPAASGDSETVSGEGAGQSATGDCADLAGNSVSDTEEDINIDLTDPTIAFVSRIPSPNGAGWNKTAVTVTWSCADDLSGEVAATVSATRSGEGADQTATGVCEDAAGNIASAAVNDIDIDLTDPYGIAWTGGPAEGASFYFGSVPAAPTCSAFDDLSGLASCTVTGYGTGVGQQTMTATAVDVAGNDATVTRSYTVLAWNLRGFYSPVDMNGVWNTVKGGSTVPLKWEMFTDVEITDPAAITSITATPVSCLGGTADDIEITSTGGTTSPRYDWTAGQFIYNWQTPKKPGACYRLTMAAGGTSISALFKLK